MSGIQYPTAKLMGTIQRTAPKRLHDSAPTEDECPNCNGEGYSNIWNTVSHPCMETDGNRSEQWNKDEQKRKYNTWPTHRKINSADGAQFSNEGTSMQCIISWTPNWISETVSSINGHTGAATVVSATINDSIGKVHIPAIMKEVTGEINAVIDSITWEKK